MFTTINIDTRGNVTQIQSIVQIFFYLNQGQSFFPQLHRGVHIGLHGVEAGFVETKQVRNHLAEKAFAPQVQVSAFQP